ncbi:MAG TPA: hypothetical protein PKA91_10085, partial [Leptospiraceae bacterium]|nr:hypothetical protein [Leptospiraceae bacterium]
WLDLSDEAHHFPHLSTWDPCLLTERLTASVEAEGKDVNYQNLRGFAAILESDLEDRFGIPKSTRKPIRKTASKRRTR